MRHQYFAAGVKIPFMKTGFQIVKFTLKKVTMVGKYNNCPMLEQAHLGSERYKTVSLFGIQSPGKSISKISI